MFMTLKEVDELFDNPCLKNLKRRAEEMGLVGVTNKHLIKNLRKLRSRMVIAPCGCVTANYAPTSSGHVGKTITWHKVGWSPQVAEVLLLISGGYPPAPEADYLAHNCPHQFPACATLGHCRYDTKKADAQQAVTEGTHSTGKKVAKLETEKNAKDVFGLLECGLSLQVAAKEVGRTYAWAKHVTRKKAICRHLFPPAPPSDQQGAA